MSLYCLEHSDAAICLLPPNGRRYTGRDSFAFLPLRETGKNQGSNQFLNWLQQYATGILRFNLSSPVPARSANKSEDTRKGYPHFYLWE